MPHRRVVITALIILARLAAWAAAGAAVTPRGATVIPAQAGIQSRAGSE